MKDYPFEKYRFITSGNKVIALSTYAGKVVRGIAKCAPGDEFDIEKGKKIAAARCATKIAHKRVCRAAQKVEEAEIAFAKAQKFKNDMLLYLNESTRAITDCLMNEVDALDEF